MVIFIGRAGSGAEQAMPIEKVNVAEKLAQFDDAWNPRVIGDVNAMQVKVVKLLGPFTWHLPTRTERDKERPVQGRVRLSGRDMRVASPVRVKQHVSQMP